MNCKRNETHEKLKGSVKELESHVNLFAMKVQNMRQILVLYLAWCGLTQNKHVRRNFVNRFEVVSLEDRNGRPSHYITNENHRHGLKKGQRTRQYDDCICIFLFRSMHEWKWLFLFSIYVLKCFIKSFISNFC